MGKFDTANNAASLVSLTAGQIAGVVVGVLIIVVGAVAAVLNHQRRKRISQQHDGKYIGDRERYGYRINRD